MRWASTSIFTRNPTRTRNHRGVINISDQYQCFIFLQLIDYFRGDKQISSFASYLNFMEIRGRKSSNVCYRILLPSLHRSIAPQVSAYIGRLPLRIVFNVS